MALDDGKSKAKCLLTAQHEVGNSAPLTQSTSIDMIIIRSVNVSKENAVGITNEVAVRST